MLVISNGQDLKVHVVPPTSVVPVTDLDFVAAFVDVGDPATYAPENTHGTVDETAAVVAVAGPAASLLRQVKFLSVYNADGGTQGVRVFLDEGANERTIVQLDLAAGSSLIYTDGAGFRVIDQTGAILVTT
jgi:hypothetical protein